MIPKSLSATALQVWESCPARYVAESLTRTPMKSGAAADLGSVCHTALEEYVKTTYVKPEHEPSLDRLVTLYTTAFADLIGPTSGDAYDDGVKMMHNWYPRSADLSDGRRIASLETKDHFTVKTSNGPLDFNYIFDRLDEHEDGSVEVVDYKSIRARLSPDGLKDKIQARCYGVAAQILYPDAPRVWVTFDLLRYDPVGIVFSREENLATWRYIKRKAEDILATPADEAPETINPDCRWCIRKQACKTLIHHVEAGGALGITDPLEAAQKRAVMEHRMKALEAGIAELDAFILDQAERDDTDAYEDDDITVTIGARRTRTIKSAERALEILGPERSAKYGSMTVTGLDKALKNEVLDDEQEAALRALIGYKTGNPSVRVVPKNPID